MDDEAGFLTAIAAAPDDLTAHLAYADWLEEHSDPGSAVLRNWVRLIQLHYEEAEYRSLVSLVELFRASLRAADPDWVELVGQAREWVGAELAELAARLHLRVHEGRKSDRQWIAVVHRDMFYPVWHVSYWQNAPARRKRVALLRREGKKCLLIDAVTAEVKPSI